MAAHRGGDAAAAETRDASEPSDGERPSPEPEDAGLSADGEAPPTTGGDAETPAVTPEVSWGTAFTPVAPGNLADWDIVSERCIVRPSGQVACSGYNNLGQLGIGERGGVNGGLAFSDTLRDVPGLTDAVDVFVAPGSEDYACALLADGHLRCWGAVPPSLGGGGSAAPSLSPTLVPGIEHVSALGDSGGREGGGELFYYGLTSDHHYYCWSGQSAPVLMQGTWLELPVYTHSEARLFDWGVHPVHYAEEAARSDSGELFTIDAPIGTTASCAMVSVSGNIKVSKDKPLNSVYRHGLILDDAGSVWCRASCPLGGANLASASTWTLVPGLDDVRSLTSSSCAVKNDDSVWCWGAFDGPRGNSLYTAPVNVGTADGFSSFTVARTSRQSFIDAYGPTAADLNLGASVLVELAESESGYSYIWRLPAAP
jgi:hypothetical protein